MIVLNFHSIGRPKRGFAEGEGDVSVDRRQFAEILDVVRGRRDVRLTFDDGNRSDVSEALPELLRRGLRAEFFICPGRFGTPEFLDEDGVRELHQAGMSVGSHGMDHVPWRRLGPSGIDREIVEAKQILEDGFAGTGGRRGVSVRAYGGRSGPCERRVSRAPTRATAVEPAPPIG